MIVNLCLSVGYREANQGSHVLRHFLQDIVRSIGGEERPVAVRLVADSSSEALFFLDLESLFVESDGLVQAKVITAWENS